MGLVVGAEYLFSQHFSFGGEFSVVNSVYDPDTSSPDDDETNLLTESGMFVRFYF